MRLVTPGKDGNIICTGRKLSGLELNALISVFTGERAATDDQKRLSMNILRKAWDNKEWLECSCRVIHGKSPVMSIRRNFNDTYTLVRLHDRPVHTPNCPFKRIGSSATGNRQSKRSQSTIDRLLSCVIKELQLFRHNFQSNEQLSDLKQKYEHAKATILGYTESIGLTEQHIITHPVRLVALAELLRRQKEDERRIGMLFTTIDRFQENRMIYEDKRYGKVREVEFSDSVHLHSPFRIDASCDGPYLTLAEIAESGSRKNWFAPTAISRIPVYDKRTLFPVTKNAERITLSALLKTQSWLMQKMQVGTILEKPYVEDGEDFRVCYGEGGYIPIVSYVTDSEKITLPEVTEGVNMPLFHIVLRNSDTERQRRLTSKFQKILTARILSSLSNNQMEEEVNAVCNA